jgi:hypothetical protein
MLMRDLTAHTIMMHPCLHAACCNAALQAATVALHATAPLHCLVKHRCVKRIEYLLCSFTNHMVVYMVSSSLRLVGQHNSEHSVPEDQLAVPNLCKGMIKVNSNVVSA